MDDTEMGSPVVRRVVRLVQPILDDLGLSLYDCEHQGGVLTITVDKQGGVALDEIALLTRLLSRDLDHEDPVPGRYTLEVSSPGLERRLRRREHFRMSVGATIAVRLRDALNGERRLEGVLVSTDDDGILIRSGDADRSVTYDQIDRARTVFVWETTPKPGKGPGKTTKAARQTATPASAGSSVDAQHEPTITKEAAAS
jgi:ribosome maturation factor RimP